MKTKNPQCLCRQRYLVDSQVHELWGKQICAGDLEFAIVTMLVPEKSSGND